MLQNSVSFVKALVPEMSLKVVSLCLTWYSVSSISSQVTKKILNEFPFPLALGEFQFFIVMTLCAITMVLLPRFPKLHSMFPPSSVPPLHKTSLFKPDKHIFMTVLPLGCFQFLGKLFSHSATALVPVSTVAGIKTLSPLILVLTYRVIYNVKFPLTTYLSLIPLILGILLIVVADTQNTLVDTTTAISTAQYVGILYASLSLVVFVAQNIYGKTVFTYDQKTVNNHADLALGNEAEKEEPTLPVSSSYSKDAKDLEQSKRFQAYDFEVEKSQLTSFPKIRNRYDKLTLLVNCSAIGFLLSLPWFLYIEVPHFINFENKEDATEAHLVTIPWNLLLVNGFSHFLQSLMAFHLLGAIPTVSYSIASMMKKIIIIVVSMLFAGHEITKIQFVGLTLTAAGLYSYDKWGARK